MNPSDNTFDDSIPFDEMPPENEPYEEPTYRRRERAQTTLPSGEAEERIVLGAMMQSADAIGDILDILRPEDFYRPKHTAIFDAIVKLYANGEPADAVAVTAQLLSTGDIQRVGGAPYLYDCADAVPTVANGTYYARRVADLARRRRLIEAGTKVVQAAYNPEHDIDEVTNLAETAVYDATMQREGKDLKAIGMILPGALESIRAAAESGTGMRGISTGFADLDKLTGGLRPGQLVVVAGRPGMGKSIFAVDVARANAIRDDRPVAVFSLEMSEEEILTRILAAESRVKLTKLTDGGADPGDWDHLHRASAKIGQAPLHIDDTPGVTLTEIRSRARRMKQRHKLSLLVVDYLQLMTPSGRRTESRQQEVADISRGLKLLAKELEIPVIAVAQLNRGVEQRADKRPMLSDLRESGALEQDADIVIFVHREDYYDKESPRMGEADLIVAKHRGGPTDTVAVAAQLHLARFADMAVAQ